MRASYRNALTLAALISLSAGTVGCQKYRAEKSLEKTSQVLADIEQRYDGRTHEAQRLEALRRQVEEAQGQLQFDAGNALSIASQARTEANLILESVRPKQAETVRGAATEEIRIANVNDLQRFDSARFERIRDLESRMQTAYSENKWDDVINLGQSVIREVDQGLAPLRTEAERARNNAENKLNELLVIGGQQFSLESVTTVQTQLEQARQIYDRDRDYQLARTRFAEAASRADTGIIQTKNERSRLALETIEGLLTTALIEGGDIYLPAAYNDALRLYEESLTKYQAGNFDEVLGTAELLTARCRQLVLETKRAASDERISQMDQRIQELENGGILTYLPNSTSTLRGYLGQARQLRPQDTEVAFDEIKDVNILYVEEYDRVKRSFAQLAEDSIIRSRGSLETTRAIYTEVQGIFDPLEGELTSEQKTFEEQKELRRVELGNNIQEANQRLIVADERLASERFRDAIVTSEEVAAESARIRAGVYHVVAHNAAIELARLISRYEREGARLYAQEELSRSTQRLEEVKSLVADGQFEEAVRRAAEARADTELMAQRIAGRATENVREARAALDSASSEKVRLYQAAELERVATLIDEATEDLQADRLKLAVEKAQSAIDLTRQAQTEANRQAATRQIDAASARIIEAQDARSEVFAGRDMEESRRLLTSARALFSTGDFEKAEDLSRLSEERAESALFNRIRAAETEIATANSVGGWEFNNRRLALANQQLAEARELLAQRDYSRSRSLADSAASNARSVADGAKEKNFRDRIARIRQNLNEGTRGGINYFQPDESIQARRDLTKIEGDFSVANYDAAMRDVERLEAQLRITIDGTNELVTTVAQQQEARLSRLEQAGATAYASAEIITARNNLKYAVLDYERGLYRSAHSNLGDAIRQINEIEDRRSIESYARAIDDLFEDFRVLQEDFSNILTLTPYELKQLATGPNGHAQPIAISAKITPLEYRNRAEDLYNRALAIQAPPQMRLNHENVVQAMAEARLSALGFERLTILNRMATAEAASLIDQSYARLNNANRLVSNVQSALIADRRRVRSIQPGQLSTLVTHR